MPKDDTRVQISLRVTIENIDPDTLTPKRRQLLKHYLANEVGQQDTLVIEALDSLIPGFKAAGSDHSVWVERPDDTSHESKPIEHRYSTLRKELQQYVTKDAFHPVQLIVYGAVALVLAAVVLLTLGRFVL